MLQLSRVNGVTIYGPEPRRGRAALCAFNVAGVHPNDLSMIMDQEGGSPECNCSSWQSEALT